MANLNSHQVNVGEDHLKRVSKASALSAIEELIWNSLDADSNSVSLRIENNPTGGNLSISVTDDGTGMSPRDVTNYISFLGNSWKSRKTETASGRPIHGQKGEGRFKSFSLGRVVDWQSTYKDKDDTYRIDVHFISDNIKQYSVSEPIKLDSNKPTGLTVTISELAKPVAGNAFEDLEHKLIQTFGAYLYNYQNITLNVNGYPLNVHEAIDDIHEFSLQVEGLAGSHQLKVIEWQEIDAKQLMLCKDNGTVLKELKFDGRKIRSLGYSFTAHLISNLITQFNDASTLDLFELDTFGKSLLEQAYNKLNQHFAEKRKAENLARLERWKDEGVYPFVDNNDMGAIETAKREIFDIIASKVEDKLPKFDRVDSKTKQFTFKLLSQAIQDNPKSMQKIMGEVLNLNSDEQNDFAKLLEKTTLPSVIKSAQVVADRLDFLEGLSTLLFDYKQSLLERDQLHKILENEAWIFDEYFDLAGSEKRLEDALAIHLRLLGDREDEIDTNAPVMVDEDKQGRLDLMLSKAVASKDGYKDFLVVELKRPSKKIDDEVITQIKKYAMAVQEDERFDINKCKWKFIAVCNTMNKFAEREANQTGRPSGCVYQSDNLEVYTMTWAQIIENAKTRLKFYKEHLQYEADEETSKQYLQAMHNKFIPTELQVDKQ